MESDERGELAVSKRSYFLNFHTRKVPAAPDSSLYVRQRDRPKRHRAECGGQTVFVGVLRSSPANRFYQRHGFTPNGESERAIYYTRWQ